MKQFMGRVGMGQTIRDWWTRRLRGLAASTLASLAVLVLALTAGGCAAKASRGQFGSGYVRVEASPEIHALERRMAQRLNRDRANAGLPPLEYDERLADIARAHSADMTSHGFFAHESPNTGTLEDRIVRAGYLALEARENLAEASDVDTAEDNLLASPGHHANIMSKTVSHLGIGIVKGGVADARNMTFTQVFTSPGKVESLSEARAAIVEFLLGARKRAGLPKMTPNAELDRLAEEQIDELVGEPTPEALKTLGVSIAEQMAKSPIRGVSGVSVGGQLLWDSQQFAPPATTTKPGVSEYGLALRRVEDEKGRPQLKLLILIGI